MPVLDRQLEVSTDRALTSWPQSISRAPRVELLVHQPQQLGERRDRRRDDVALDPRDRSLRRSCAGGELPLRAGRAGGGRRGAAPLRSSRRTISDQIFALRAGDGRDRLRGRFCRLARGSGGRARIRFRISRTATDGVARSAAAPALTSASTCSHRRDRLRVVRDPAAQPLGDGSGLGLPQHVGGERTLLALEVFHSARRASVFLPALLAGEGGDQRPDAPSPSCEPVVDREVDAGGLLEADAPSPPAAASNAARRSGPGGRRIVRFGSCGEQFAYAGSAGV